MTSFLQKLLFTISALAAAFSLLLVILTICGLRLFIVKSGSMEPLYRKGSLILVNTRINLDEIRIGDVLVYRPDSGALVMHRLVAVNAVAANAAAEGGAAEEETTVSTSGPVIATFRGDANRTSEKIELSDANLVGSAAYSLFIPGISVIVEKVLSVQWIFWILICLALILACIPWKSKETRYENTGH